MRSQMTAAQHAPRINRFIIATLAADRPREFLITLEEVRRRAIGSGPLRLLFPGQCDPTQGLHVLCRKLLPISISETFTSMIIVVSLEVSHISYAREMSVNAARMFTAKCPPFTASWIGPLLIEKISRLMSVIPSF